MTREEVRQEIAAAFRMLATVWEQGSFFEISLKTVADQLEATPPEPVKLNPCGKCGRPFNVVSEYKNDCECGNSTKWFKKESDADAAWNAANPVTPLKPEPVYDIGAEFRDHYGGKWVLFENPWTGCCTLMSEVSGLFRLEPHVDKLPLPASELFEHPEEWTPIP